MILSSYCSYSLLYQLGHVRVFHVELLTLRFQISLSDNINYAFFASSMHRMSLLHLQKFCMNSFLHKEPSFGNFISYSHRHRHRNKRSTNKMMKNYHFKWDVIANNCIRRQAKGMERMRKYSRHLEQIYHHFERCCCLPLIFTNIPFNLIY